MDGWLAALGTMAWPLLASSVLGCSVVFERLWFFLRTSQPPLLDQALLKRLAAEDPQALESYLVRKRHPWRTGIGLLLAHAQQPMALREEALSLWFDEQRALQTQHVRWLTLVAVVSPLLGLLGTVLGMIEAFAALAAHTGPIRPALLADGLHQAMYTTAFGLIIAVPALTAAHIFGLWADARSARLRHLLNRAHLAIEGAGPGAPQAALGARPLAAEPA